MAYQTGSSSGIEDLMMRMRVFAESIGWVTTASSASMWAFRSTEGGNFAMVRSSSTPDLVQLYGATSNLPNVLNPLVYPGNSQTHPVREYTAAQFKPGSVGPFTRYHLFGTLQYLHLALEVQAGVFAHLFFGRLNKKGMKYNGGEYIQGSYFRYSHGQIFSVNTPSPTGNWTNYGPTSPWARGNLGVVRAGGFGLYPEPNWFVETVGLGLGPYTGRHPDGALSAACKCNYLRKPLVVPNRVLLLPDANAPDTRGRMLGETPDFGITDMGRNSPGDLPATADHC